MNQVQAIPSGSESESGIRNQESGTRRCPNSIDATCCDSSPPRRWRPASRGPRPRRARPTTWRRPPSRRRRPARRSRRSSSRRTNGRPCACWSTSIIPKDERSGSATDAGVPEFMDFIVLDQPARQTAMRGGLAWLDLECQSRFDKTFVDCAARRAHGGARRHRVAAARQAGTSAWRRVLQQLPRPHRHRVLDDQMGIDDLQYLGNRSVARWNGCPDEALKKLGLV